MKRCSNCEEMQVIDSTCQRCKDLNDFDELMGVTPEEKRALWSESDEKRMDIIGPNGNDGDHYE